MTLVAKNFHVAKLLHFLWEQLATQEVMHHLCSIFRYFQLATELTSHSNDSQYQSNRGFTINQNTERCCSSLIKMARCICWYSPPSTRVHVSCVSLTLISWQEEAPRTGYNRLTLPLRRCSVISALRVGNCPFSPSPQIQELLPKVLTLSAPVPHCMLHQEGDGTSSRAQLPATTHWPQLHITQLHNIFSIIITAPHSCDLLKHIPQPVLNWTGSFYSTTCRCMLPSALKNQGSPNPTIP